MGLTKGQIKTITKLTEKIKFTQMVVDVPNNGDPNITITLKGGQTEFKAILNGDGRKVG